MDVIETGFEPGHRVRQALRPTIWIQWEKDSPSFEPWWRWGCASHLIKERVAPPDWPDDEHVRRLVRFITSPAPTRDKPLWAAFDIFSGPQLRRALVEAYLLTGKSPTTVARRTGIPVGVMKLYAEMFCSIKGRLRMCDWIASQFFYRSDGMSVVESRVSGEWKRAGWGLGIESLDAVVAASFCFGVVQCKGWSLPVLLEVGVLDLAAARRTVLARLLSETQVQAMNMVVKAVGTGGVKFMVNEGVVKVGIKDSLIGRSGGG